MRIVLLCLLLQVRRGGCNETCTQVDSIRCRWSGRTEKVKEENVQELRRIAIMYYAPSSAKRSVDVGLELAVSIWSAHSGRVVTWLNTADLEGAAVPQRGELCTFMLEHFDHIFVKSNWDYVVDRFVREYLWTEQNEACPITRSLQIAGSYPPPREKEALDMYDLYFYETQWYGQTFFASDRNLLAVHAFGIDVETVKEQCRSARSLQNNSITYDWLFVGAFADHAGFKRPERLALRSGKRLAMGKLRDNSPGDPLEVSQAAKPVVDLLTQAGVDIRPPVPWGPQYFSILVDTRQVYIPDDWRGGGERLVLESRACGRLDLVIESDNPKLYSLATEEPLYTTLYYAGQLEAGILRLEHRLSSAYTQQQFDTINNKNTKSTCGLAPSICHKSEAAIAHVDLDHPLPSTQAK